VYDTRPCLPINEILLMFTTWRLYKCSGLIFCLAHTSCKGMSHAGAARPALVLLLLLLFIGQLAHEFLHVKLAAVLAIFPELAHPVQHGLQG